MPFLVLGRDGWIRTSECGSQSPMPCHLATPPYNAAEAAWCWRWDSNPHGFPCDFESQLSASSSTPTYPPTILITKLCVLLSKSLVLILGRKTSETSPERLSFSLFLYYHNSISLSIVFSGIYKSFFQDSQISQHSKPVPSKQTLWLPVCSLSDIDRSGWL